MGDVFTDTVQAVHAMRQEAALIGSGYGGVNQAMSLGVPLVCAGLTEEGRRECATRRPSPHLLAATLMVSPNSSGRGDFARGLYVENDLPSRG